MFDFLRRLRPEGRGPGKDRRSLEASEAHNQALINAIPDLLFELGLDGRYHDAHSLNPDLLVATRETLVGRTVPSVLPPPAAEVVMAALREAHETGRSRGRTYQLELPQGRTWFELSVAAKAGEPGQDPRFIVLARDITERRVAGEALRESEERLRLAMEATHDGLWDWNVATGEIFFSPTYNRMLGYEPGASRRPVAAWTDLLVPEEREQVMARIRECTEGTRPDFEIEHRIRTRDGGIKWILGRGQTVSRDGRGRALRMAGTTVDITGRRQAEEALRVSEDKLARIFQLSPDAIDLVRTTDRVCLDFNEAYSNLFGYSRSEFIGKPLLPEDMDIWVDLADRDRLMASLKEHGMVLGFETPCRRKDGSIFISEISVAALEIAGQPCHLSFTRDITGRRQAEEERSMLKDRLLQAQKLEALGGLVSGVAHNMNNVLAVIMGTASMREARATDPSDLKAFSTIGKVCARGRDVVKSLLHFAEPTLSIQEPFELNRMVREAGALLDSTTMNKIRITETLAGEPLWVFGDAESINLALMNICSNSCHAMADGGRLSLGTAVLEGNWVEVSVEDDGAGMSTEVLARMMDPFYTTKDVGKGTGLGLSMTYGAVKAHGGTIDIASRPGRGTRVKLRFPRIPAPVRERPGLRTS